MTCPQYLGGINLDVPYTVQELGTQDKLNGQVCAGSSQDNSETQGLSWSIRCPQVSTLLKK